MHGEERILHDLFVALQETMETMAFAVVDKLQEENRDDYEFDEDNSLWAKLSIDSKLNGVSSVGVVLSSELVDYLINNMYSDTVVMNKEQQETDAMAELANILVGTFMIKIEDIMGDFTLSLPEVGKGPVLFAEDSIEMECIIAEKYYMQAIVEL